LSVFSSLLSATYQLTCQVVEGDSLHLDDTYHLKVFQTQQKDVGVSPDQGHGVTSLYQFHLVSVDILEERVLHSALLLGSSIYQPYKLLVVVENAHTELILLILNDTCDLLVFEVALVLIQH